jgi:8-oxo-dGTP pyrophosphatase MutT (NUDIX family)
MSGNQQDLSAPRLHALPAFADILLAAEFRRDLGAFMGIAPHIRRLRELVGNELLVLPGAAVLPRDDSGRLLLVRIIETGQWSVIGGAIDPDESPQQAALREAREEAGVELQLGPVVAVLGGPKYRVTYPNGDQSSYVSTVFAATVLSGTPTPDGEETSDVKWFDTDQLPWREMGSFARALLSDTGFEMPSIPAP